MDESNNGTPPEGADAGEQGIDSGEGQEKTYTRAELEAELKRARDAAFAEARRTLKPKRQDDAKQSSKASNDKGEDRVSRLLAQRDALDDVLAGKAVTAEQRKDLRQLMELADPEDPVAWAESFAAKFLAGAKTETTQSNSQPKEPPVMRKPGDDPGPAQALPPWERPSDPFKWTPEDIARLEAQKGKREAYRIIRRKAEEFARSMRIQVSPTRR